VKWLITGDWQTRFSNLKECEIAHKQEIRIINEHKIDGHIDLGDLKDEYSPVAVEVIEFQFARTKAILDLVSPKNSIKLLGNHDRIGQNSDERNWLDLFVYLGGNIITDADVIHTKSVAVFGLPYNRNPERFLENADYLYKRSNKIDDRPKILIFHQDVKDAKYSKLRGKPSASNITLEGMHTRSYVQCFGGHIHLRQNLDNNARYVGSPFAVDWGEIDQRKGFTVYDDHTNKVSFIESEVPGRYSYVYLQKNKVKQVSDGTQIKDTVICSSIGSAYHKKIEKRIREITKAYPNTNVQVVPKFKDGSGSVEEISPDGTEEQKLRLYISSSLPLALKKHKKKVIAYLQSIMNQSLGKRIRSSDKVIFESIEATNVLSFERLKFNYRRCGTVLVTGKNKSGGVLESNGAGKTNFLSMPCVALEGKTFKGQHYDSWANWRTKGPAVVTQNLRTSKGTKISVIRGRRPARLQILVNGKDASGGLNANACQKRIEEITGYTDDTLANSVYVDQTLSNAFILGTDKSRAELIARFQNLDKYEDARKLAAKDLSRLDTTESETEYEISLLKEHLKEKKREARHAVSEVSQKRKKLLKKLKIEKSLLVIEKQRCKQRVSKLMSSFRADNTSSKIAHYEKDEKRISSELMMMETIIDGHRRSLEQVKKISALDKCPTCLRDMTKDSRQSIIAQAKKAIEKAKKKIKALSVEEKQIEKKLSKLRRRSEHIEEQIEQFKSFVEGRRRSVSYAKEKLKAFEETVSHTTTQSKIESTKRKISVSKRYLDDIDRQKMIVGFAVETFSRKGFPAFLSKLVCPILNKASESYSNLFLDGEIKVVFDVENDTLTPHIVNPNGDKEIQGQSTGEKAWAGLIASFALREIAQPSNLLILDEPGHGLDASSARRFGERIRQLESRFETILICTHNQHIQAALESASSVEIVKKNKVSKLVLR
jgi:Calcineurin-like phosphoesterase